MTDIWWMIVLAALLTYGTRVAGYLAVARMGAIPPRLDAALNAVPAAVLTAIVMPVLVDGDWAERAVIVLSAFLALRLSLLWTVIVGTALVAGLRAFGLS